MDPDEWSSASAIWIRTWYGNEADERGSRKGDSATRASADVAYARLWQKALWPLDKHGLDDSMFGLYVFDDNAAAYSVSARDADDDVELMDEIPSFVLSALTRCPDVMEGSSGRDIEDEEERQRALDELGEEGERKRKRQELDQMHRELTKQKITFT